jgi:hypothetical protein
MRAAAGFAAVHPAGYDLLKVLRDSGGKVPFFIFAGSDTPEYRREATKRSAQDERRNRWAKRLCTCACNGSNNDIAYTLEAFLDVIRQTQRKCNHRQRGIERAAGGEYRAAGHI